MQIHIYRKSCLWFIFSPLGQKFVVGSPEDALVSAAHLVLKKGDPVQEGGLAVRVATNCPKLVRLVADINKHLSPSNPYPVEGDLAANVLFWVAARFGITFSGELTVAKSRTKKEVTWKKCVFPGMLEADYFETDNGIEVGQISLLPGLAELVKGILAQACGSALTDVAAQAGLTLKDDTSAEAAAEAASAEEENEFLGDDGDAEGNPDLADGEEDEALEGLPFEDEEEQPQSVDEDEVVDASGTVDEDEDGVLEEEDEEGSVSVSSDDDDDEPVVVGGTDDEDADDDPELVDNEDDVELVGSEELQVENVQTPKPAADKKPAAKTTKPAKTVKLVGEFQEKFTKWLDATKTRLVNMDKKDFVPLAKQTLGTEIAKFKGRPQSDATQAVLDVLAERKRNELLKAQAEAAGA